MVRRGCWRFELITEYFVLEDGLLLSVSIRAFVLQELLGYTYMSYWVERWRICALYLHLISNLKTNSTRRC